MTITDLDGKTITVTDLPEAIKQAAMFKGFRHKDRSFKKMDDRLQAYWTDVHKKLLQLYNQKPSIKRHEHFIR